MNKKIILKIFVIAIFSILVLYIFSSFNIDKDNKKEYVSLVAFGDNIDTETKPFVQGNGVYLSVDTISKLIDDNIYYDKLATKVIVTKDDKIIKLKVDENKMYVNFEEKNIDTPAKYIESEAYVDIELLKDLYNLNVTYNKEKSIITIDKKEVENASTIKFNRVKVYSDISTSSNVLQTLDDMDKVTVYEKSLVHSRWYKIKTSTGVVGYIAKNSVNVASTDDDKTQDTTNTQTQKINLSWQYVGNSNTTNCAKVEGVNVVSPTWFELKNSSGDITSKFNQTYYNNAKNNGYKIWPIVTNGIDSVNYSSDDTSLFLKSESNREKFIKNLVGICKKYKFEGINMDFESLKVDDRSLYTQLIREMAATFKANDLTLSVDLYFVEYMDRKNIGEVADYVCLMGYDQRGNWSVDDIGSIAEISWVDSKVNSLINDSNIDPQKIILGVPFYTRVWNINNKTGDVKSSIYTMKDCVDFVDSHNLTTSFDEKSGQNYAEYTSGSITYKLWIEDATSMKSRLDIITKYKLAGIATWRKGLETDDIWNVINENLNS